MFSTSASSSALASGLPGVASQRGRKTSSITCPTPTSSSRLYPGGGSTMPNTRLRLPVGKYSDLGSRVQAMPRETPTRTTTTLRRIAVLPLILYTLLAIASRTRPPIRSKTPACVSLLRLRIWLARLGMTLTATMRLSTTEQETAIAISRNSCPASSSTKTIGRKIATVVSVLANMAPQTSRAPS